jgi:Zn-dependent M28 family amino/carboxypeptidase
MGNAAIRAPTMTLEARLRRHVEHLAGTIGERNVTRPAALAAARDYIETAFRDQGLTVTRQTYAAEGIACSNLEVTIPGGARPGTMLPGPMLAGPMLLVGAHYDTVRGSPGADDNASGVAALLELAAGFRAVCPAPALSLRFVAFVNEEAPFFLTDRQGSAVYARAARARGDDIRLMIALEMLGHYSERPGSQRYPPLFRRFYPDRGNFLALVSDFRSLGVTRRVAAAFRAQSEFPLEYAGLFRWYPGVGWSDHRPFWQAGYRALMATDTAFNRYPHYHTAADTPDKLAYPAFAAATEGLLGAIAALAGTGPHRLVR